MAEKHFKSSCVVNKTAKTERYYTVGYAPQNGRPNPPSAINLKGRWLEASGFMTGIPSPLQWSEAG
ncbi:type I toxin-antitoxin system SymE family toxin [Brenneria izadpanahii]|uniref:Type I toxin-antitoxin system SymE family toxin n=1 Tax=Brenneria izadpanahii TaxID=2722756 RepID=A0ABX7V1Y4_9GAMM|nr:SymE family type I addiction module toxin [Brenneria izadpanahii]QTF09873.1 type I toxin-antitoxin system SymE family toxin [Brenneria izadpanahii]